MNLAVAFRGAWPARGFFARQEHASLFRDLSDIVNVEGRSTKGQDRESGVPGHEQYPFGHPEKVRTKVGRQIRPAGSAVGAPRAHRRRAGSAPSRARQSQNENPPR
jgi:hypothetical protein